MCLSTIDDNYPRTINEGIGYKVFGEDKDFRLLSLFMPIEQNNDVVSVNKAVISNRQMGNYQFEPHNSDYVVLRNKWHKAINHRVESHVDKKPYQSGFHIFPNWGEATDWAKCWKCIPMYRIIVQQVFWRNLICFGKQDGFDCIVADEMFIVPYLEENKNANI